MHRKNPGWGDIFQKINTTNRMELNGENNRINFNPRKAIK
jgi:hypothetical protein